MPQRAFRGVGDPSFGMLIVPLDASCRAYAWRIMDGVTLETVERSDIAFHTPEAALSACLPAFTRWVATHSAQANASSALASAANEAGTELT